MNGALQPATLALFYTEFGFLYRSLNKCLQTCLGTTFILFLLFFKCEMSSDLVSIDWAAELKHLADPVMM